MSNVRWPATVRFWSILSQCCVNVWCFSMKFYKILECLESHFRLHFLQKLIYSKGTSKIYRIGFCGHRLSKPRRKICSIHVSVWNEFTSSLFYHHHHEFDERFDMACEFIMWHRFGSVLLCILYWMFWTKPDRNIVPFISWWPLSECLFGCVCACARSNSLYGCDWLCVDGDGILLYPLMFVANVFSCVIISFVWHYFALVLILYMNLFNLAAEWMWTKSWWKWTERQRKWRIKREEERKKERTIPNI